MKVYILISEQDTDSRTGAGVQVFLDKDAASEEMHRQYDEELAAWNINIEDIGKDQESWVVDAAAVIRDGIDSIRWRIEERDLDVQAAVRVVGGQVGAVYSNADISVEVYDLDVSDYPCEGEQEAADARKHELEKLISNPHWQIAW